MSTSIFDGLAQEDTLETVAKDATVATSNTKLTSIDGKIPVKGSATSANSTPVVIASDQTLTATVSGTVAVTNSALTSIDGKIPSKGTAVTANSTPVNIASDQTVATSIAGSVAVTNAALTSLDTKTPSKGSSNVAGSSPVNIATDQVTLLAQDTSISTGNASLSSIDGKASTINTSIGTSNTKLTSIDGKIPSQGAAVKSASLPVNIASDQVTLLAQDSTVAKDATVSAMSAKIPALGQSTKSGSLPVSLASDQGTLETSIAKTVTTGQSLSTAVNSAVTITLNDAASLALLITPGGTGAGVVRFEASFDGTVWFDCPGLNAQVAIGTNVVTATSSALVTGTNQVYRFNVAGYAQFRARVTTLLGSAATLAYGFSAVPIVLETSTSTQLNTGVSISSNVLPINSSILGHTLAAAATTNATNVKNSAGNLLTLTVSNIQASTAVYLKLYNKASAPTVGTDTPTMVIPIPPQGLTPTTEAGFFKMEFGMLGMRFTTGISYAITLLNTVADTTAVASANVVFVQASYF